MSMKLISLRVCHQATHYTLVTVPHGTYREYVWCLGAYNENMVCIIH